MSGKTLISVFDKSGLVEALAPLHKLGYTERLASAGTAKLLTESGMPTDDVASLVGGGPILGHKVVTLSREVHAGLLASEAEQAELNELGIPRIEILIVGFYPLHAALVDPGRTLASVLQSLDIGGPTMVMSAVKGGRIVVVDLNDIPQLVRYLKGELSDGPGFLATLWWKAAARVAEYYASLAMYLNEYRR
ncbi:MAG: hypothetical protein H6760_04975 [Candidatus Nomurabacteria bacterium]|nr:MAG: hypothetical protein H6760_04975 [Candidatus Nomurabacteria bacterium]